MPKSVYAYCIFILIAASNEFNAEAKAVYVVELTDSWILTNGSSTEQVNVAKLPSSVYAALEQVHGNLLEANNDLLLRWIANENWTYSTSFDGDETGYNSLVNLTLHGIDTVANVRLNGQLLGQTNNMFVRYSYEIGLLLRPKKNVLEIELLSPLLEAKARALALAEQGLIAPPSCTSSNIDVECYGNMLRKMQMSFGGEWNPTAPSLGIWKPITIEYYEIAIMRDVDVATSWNQSHWTMDCRAFLSTPAQENFYADLTVHVSQLLSTPFVLEAQEVNYASPILEFKVHIPQDSIELWWPNGYGKQKLYGVIFSIKSYRTVDGLSLTALTQSEKLLMIGFRTIELVENEDERGRTFFFRVNNHPIFMKGANYVPADTLPELASKTETVQHLLKSAHEAHMNMIRVYGGGLYESDAFYSLADYYGLLVWQDMAFTSATYPMSDEFVSSVRVETAQNAKRLAYHPSLALIVTNNEIEKYLVESRSDFGKEATRLEEEYKQLFMGTIRNELDIISRTDYNPRAGPMMSTPSLGVAETAKSSELPEDPQNINYGDVHFWDDYQDGFGPNIYPRARFISEFGYASLPILSSWQRALGSADNSNLASLIKHRQHDPKGFEPLLRLIDHHLPFNADKWEDNIEDFIYFSQVAQAMTAKVAVDLFRSLRSENETMGALIWQLNDVWVAPTWSCIDFYGNYKLVFHWAKEFLAPISVIALYDESKDMLNITLTREDYTEISDSQLYNVEVNTYLWTDIFPKKTIARANVLDSNALLHLNIPFEVVLYEDHKKAETFLEITMENVEQQIVSRTYLYPVAIKNIEGIKDPELSLEVFGADCDTVTTYINSFSLRISVKYPALFVYLELDHPTYVQEKHRFSINGFTQTEPVQNVYLEFESKSACFTLTQENIKVKTMNQYILKK